jgi:hypothetical protein
MLTGLHGPLGNRLNPSQHKHTTRTEAAEAWPQGDLGRNWLLTQPPTNAHPTASAGTTAPNTVCSQSARLSDGVVRAGLVVGNANSRDSPNGAPLRATAIRQNERIACKVWACTGQQGQVMKARCGPSALNGSAQEGNCPRVQLGCQFAHHPRPASETHRWVPHGLDDGVYGSKQDTQQGRDEDLHSWLPAPKNEQEA